MSLPEVAHRAGRWAAQHAEGLAVSAGWEPKPAIEIGRKNALIYPIDGWLDEWTKRHCLNDSKLDALLRNEIQLFSHESLGIGTPVDWHLNPLTGHRVPQAFGKKLDYRDDSQFGDIKILWELGRHQHLIPLAVAYAVSSDDKYLKPISDQIEDWIASNPFGLGIHWCSSLEVALRLISWSILDGLLVLAGHQDGLFAIVAEANRLGTAIYQQAWFIRHYLSRHSSANNHLIGELSGLWITCQVFDLGRNGEKWAKFAQTQLEKQAIKQVFADGVSKEQATYYHLWVLEYLLLTWLVGRQTKAPFSETYRRRILSMSNFLEDISLKNGAPPQIGDADDGFVTRFVPDWPSDPYGDVQRAVREIFGPVAASESTSRSEKSFWFTMLTGDLPSAKSISLPIAIKRRPILYGEGGYAVLGDTDLKLVFDAGPLGYPSIAAHGHADALSFCLGLDDGWWLIDPGTYAYHSEPQWRDWFRGTTAHNTLAINDTNQSRIGGNFLWLQRAHSTIEASGQRSNGTQWVRGKHDGYRSLGVTHRRELRYIPSDHCVELHDWIEVSKPEINLRAELFLHFAPDIRIERLSSTWIVTRLDSNRTLRISTDVCCDWRLASGETSPLQGWFSPMIGVKMPSPVLTGRCNVSSGRHTTIRIDIDPI